MDRRAADAAGTDRAANPARVPDRVDPRFARLQVGTAVATALGMGAAMIPAILVICTVFLAPIAGWQPFGGFVGVVVLSMFVFIVVGLISLIGDLEQPEPKAH